MFYATANLAVVLFRVLEHVGWLHSNARATETGHFQLKTYRFIAQQSCRLAAQLVFFRM